MKLRAEIRIRNNDLIEARKAAGFSQLKLAAATGVPVAVVCALEKLDYSGGDLKIDYAERIAGFLDIEIDLVYPLSLEGTVFPSNALRYHEVDEHQLAAEVDASYLPMIDGPIDAKMLVGDYLDRLNDRERAVIKLRFGLEDPNEEQGTLRAIGKRFDLSQERIRQIENRAIRKIQEFAKDDEQD